MTLHEIESTLATLSSRHPGLDEGMLVTLLLAGGWEKKDIDEAVLLFKHGNVNQEKSVALPAVEERPALPEEIEIDHRLLEHNPKEPASLPIETIPVSLVEEKKTERKDELPHNLPLRPFETSEHIWPFARYKEVFYGEEGIVPEPKETAKKEETPAPAVKTIPEPVSKRESLFETPKVESVNFRPNLPQKTAQKTNLKRDDKLAATALAMLLCILFLLGYMYSNGRL